MISQAIQGKLVAIVPRTYFSMGDEGIEAPYCVHRENCVPLEMKGVIAEYQWECEIALIHTTPALLESVATSIRTAIETLAGTTASTTIIQDVTYQGDTPEYDEEEKLYVTILRYLITTKNR